MTRERVPRPHEYHIDPHQRLRPVRPTRILVYKGPTSEILSHISVGFLQPRSRHFPPLRLPHYIGNSIPALFGLFWEYVARLSLSLAFFNLLPVIGLDGGVVFSCLVEWWLGNRGGVRAGEEYDVELLERGVGSRPESEGINLGREKQKEMLERRASVLTIVVGVMVGVATLWQDVG
jgi:membrane-associated protease RseP (regulator of RpoE activity)